MAGAAKSATQADVTMTEAIAKNWHIRNPEVFDQKQNNASSDRLIFEREIWSISARVAAGTIFKWYYNGQWH